MKKVGDMGTGCRRSERFGPARRLLRGVVGLFGLFGLVTSFAVPASATPIISVVDGDTLQIGDRVVNLYGVDAPELGQRCFHNRIWRHCGQSAAFELKKLIDFDASPQCEPAPLNRHQVICRAGGRDIALALIRSGYALAATGSGGEYEEAEKSAREGNLGLWHMSMVSPWDWRHGRRLSLAESEEEAACPIKAVVSADGARLYYVPTDGSYRSIKIDPSAGGRLFCSDAEARSAGWRRPGEAQ